MDSVRAQTAFLHATLDDLACLQRVLNDVQDKQRLSAKERQAKHRKALVAVKDDAENVLRQREQEVAAKLRPFEAREHEFTEAIKLLRAEVEAKETEVVDLRGTLERLEKRQRRAETFETQDRERHCQVIDSLWTALHQAYGANTLLAAQRESLASHIESLSSEMDAFEAHATDPVTPILGETTDITHMKVENAQLKEHIHSLDTRVRELEMQLAQSEQVAAASLNEAHNRIAEAQTQLGHVSRELANTQTELHACKLVNEKAERLIQSERERVSLYLEEYHDRATRTITILQGKLEKSEFEVDELDKLVEHVHTVLATNPGPAAIAQLLRELEEDEEAATTDPDTAAHSSQLAGEPDQADVFLQSGTGAVDGTSMRGVVQGL